MWVGVGEKGTSSKVRGSYGVRLGRGYDGCRNLYVGCELKLVTNTMSTMSVNSGLCVIETVYPSLCLWNISKFSHQFGSSPGITPPRIVVLRIIHLKLMIWIPTRFYKDLFIRLDLPTIFGVKRRHSFLGKQLYNLYVVQNNAFSYRALGFVRDY